MYVFVCLKFLIRNYGTFIYFMTPFLWALIVYFLYIYEPQKYIWIHFMDWLLLTLESDGMCINDRCWLINNLLLHFRGKYLFRPLEHSEEITQDFFRKLYPSIITDITVSGYWLMCVLYHAHMYLCVCACVCADACGSMRFTYTNMDKMHQCLWVCCQYYDRLISYRIWSQTGSVAGTN